VLGGLPAVLRALKGSSTAGSWNTVLEPCFTGLLEQCSRLARWASRADGLK